LQSGRRHQRLIEGKNQVLLLLYLLFKVLALYPQFVFFCRGSRQKILPI
jgi:hypothetical protein